MPDRLDSKSLGFGLVSRRDNNHRDVELSILKLPSL